MSLPSSLSTEIALLDDSDEEQEVDEDATSLFAGWRISEEILCFRISEFKSWLIGHWKGHNLICRFLPKYYPVKSTLTSIFQRVKCKTTNFEQNLMFQKPHQQVLKTEGPLKSETSCAPSHINPFIHDFFEIFHLNLLYILM